MPETDLLICMTVFSSDVLFAKETKPTRSRDSATRTCDTIQRKKTAAAAAAWKRILNNHSSYRLVNISWSGIWNWRISFSSFPLLSEISLSITHDQKSFLTYFPPVPLPSPSTTILFGGVYLYVTAYSLENRRKTSWIWRWILATIMVHPVTFIHCWMIISAAESPIWAGSGKTYLMINKKADWRGLNGLFLSITIIEINIFIIRMDRSKLWI